MAQRISILIITYNRPDDTLALLQNLDLQQRKDEVLEEILVLDNASTTPYGAVTEYINAHPSLKARYILSGENLGVARGRNKLMEIATGGLLLVLDDDTMLPQPDALIKLSHLFDQPFFRDANTGIITVRVIYFDNKQVQVTAFPHKNFGKYAANPRFLTSYYIGCAHILKKEVLAKTGLYPEDFHYGMEEYDLSYRILNAGYTIGYDNAVTVEHKESPLGRQPGYQKVQMQWVNKSKVAWRYLPFRYFLTTAAGWAVQYLRTIKGHYGTFLLTIGKILKIPFTEKRNPVSRKTMEYLKKVEARLKF